MTGKQLKEFAEGIPDTAIVIGREKPRYNATWTQEFQLSWMSEFTLLDFDAKPTKEEAV